MAKQTVKLRRNKDGTYTVRVGRPVEHFSAHLSKAELWDAVRVAIASKGVSISDESLIQLIHEADERSLMQHS